jgi:cobalt-precorrin 5A hydrolase
MNLEASYQLIAFSNKGIQVMTHLSEILSKEGCREVVCYDTAGVRENGGLASLCESLFKKHYHAPHVLIFICATGIAVRGIAPYVKDKLTDPPVIVIDDYGQFVISLLSGHLGNANVIARDLSSLLSKEGYKATPIITTATDVRGLAGFESILKQFYIDIAKHRDDIKTLNMAIANGEKIGLLIDPLIKQNVMFNEEILCVYADFSALRTHNGPKVIIAIRTLSSWLTPEQVLDIKGHAMMHYVSRSVVLGTGCRKQLDVAHYQKELTHALTEKGIEAAAIHTFASIDLKKDEPCIHETASALHATTQFFSASFLKHFDMLFEGSTFVKETTGVSAVAGPSAFALTKDKMSLTIIKGNKCTFSFGRLTI